MKGVEMIWNFWTISAIVIFGAFLLYFLNRTAFSRLRSVASSQVGKVAKNLWSLDPLAVKNAEIDRKAEEVADATRALEECQGNIKATERSIESGEKEFNRLQAIAEQFTKENNDTKALEALTQQDEVKVKLERNRKALTNYQNTYDAFLTKMKYAKKKIYELRREASDQGVRLQMSKAEANLDKLAALVGKDNLNFDNFNEIDQEIESQIDANKAKGQVASDLARDGLEEIQAEERARTSAAKDRLAELKSKLVAK